MHTLTPVSQSFSGCLPVITIFMTTMVKKIPTSPSGKGTIDFKPVMKAIQKNKVIPVIEVATFEGVLKSIQTLNILNPA